MSRAVGAGELLVGLGSGAMPQAGISRAVGPDLSPCHNSLDVAMPPHPNPFAPMNRAVGAGKQFVGLDSWDDAPGWYQPGRGP